MVILLENGVLLLIFCNTANAIELYFYSIGMRCCQAVTVCMHHTLCLAMNLVYLQRRHHCCQSVCVTLLRMEHNVGLFTVSSFWNLSIFLEMKKTKWNNKSGAGCSTGNLFCVRFSQLAIYLNSFGNLVRCHSHIGTESDSHNWAAYCRTHSFRLQCF